MKFSKLILGIALVFFVSCQSEKKADEESDTSFNDVDTTIVPPDTAVHQQTTSSTIANPNSILITCDAVGKISISDTYADVVRKAGKENITLDSVLVDGKFYNTFCTKVWKGTAGEITINWQENKQPYQTIQDIIIDNSDATYVLENGLKLGSKLSLVNKLNGKPFSLYSFAGKNKGLLVSYNGGDLESQIPCVRPVFGLKIKLEDFQKVISAASKGGIESSAIFTARKIDPVIVKLIINSKR